MDIRLNPSGSYEEADVDYYLHRIPIEVTPSMRIGAGDILLKLSRKFKSPSDPDGVVYLGDYVNSDFADLQILGDDEEYFEEIFISDPNNDPVSLYLKDSAGYRGKFVYAIFGFDPAPSGIPIGVRNNFNITVTSIGPGSTDKTGINLVGRGTTFEITYATTPDTEVINYYVKSILVDGWNYLVAPSTPNTLPATHAPPKLIFDNISADHDVKFIFDQEFQQYWVRTTFSPSSGGTVTPDAMLYDANEDPEIIITPNVGYSISSVTDNNTPITVNTLVNLGNGSYKYQITDIIAHHNINVVFASITYLIDTSVLSGVGTLTPDDPHVVYNSDQTITITPGTGYMIDDVVVDSTSVGKVTTYTFTSITSNHTIGARFILIPKKKITVIVKATHGTQGETPLPGGYPKELPGSVNPVPGTYSIEEGNSFEYTCAVLPCCKSLTEVATGSVSHTQTKMGTVKGTLHQCNQDPTTLNLYFSSIQYIIKTTWNSGGNVYLNDAVLSRTDGLSNIQSPHRLCTGITSKSGGAGWPLDTHGPYTINWGGTGQIIFSGTSDGSGKFHVDDAFQIIVVNSNGQTKDYKDARPAQARDPIDVTSLFSPGNNTVKLMTWSTIAPYYGHSDGWLTFLAKSSAHENTQYCQSGSAYRFVPDQGYSIATVTLDGQVKGSISNYTFSSPVTGNHTLDVKFTATPSCKITASAETGGTIDPSGVNSVAFGGGLKFTITPSNGYERSNLQIDGKTEPPQGTYTFTNVQTDHTIVAKFKKISDPVIISSVICDEPLQSIVFLLDQTGSMGQMVGGSKTLASNIVNEIHNRNRLHKVCVIGYGGIGGWLLSVESAIGKVSGWVTGIDNIKNAITKTSGNTGGDEIHLDVLNYAIGQYPLKGMTIIQIGNENSYMSTNFDVVDLCHRMALLGINYILCYQPAGHYGYNMADLTTLYPLSSYYSIVGKLPQASNIISNIDTHTGMGTIDPLGRSTVQYGADKVYLITALNNSSLSQLTVDNSIVPLTNKYTFTNVQADHTIVASFKQLVKVMFIVKGKMCLSPSGKIQYFKYGSNVKFTITPQGSGVASISENGTPIQIYNNILEYTNLIEDKVIYVVITDAPAICTVVSSAGAGGTINPLGTMKYAKNSSPNYSIRADDGKVISNVLVDGSPITIQQNYPYYTHTFSLINANHTIHADFKNKSVNYNITATVIEGMGIISPSGITQVPSGSSLTYTITPSNEYKINSIYIDGGIYINPTNTYTFSNVQADHTISVKFIKAARLYTITPIISRGSGSITPSSPVKVSEGDGATFVIVAATGYKIAQINVDNIDLLDFDFDGRNYKFKNVRSDHRIAIVFEQVTTGYVISSSKEGDGTIDPLGDIGVERYGARAFLMVPASGSKLKTLLVDKTQVTPESLTNNRYRYTFSNIQSNHTIHAKFMKTPQVVASAGTGGKISPSGTTQYDFGSNASYTITPNSKYNIDSIVVDGKSVIKASPYVFTNLQTDHTIHANFSSNPHTLKVTVNGASTGTPQWQLNTTLTVNREPVSFNNSTRQWECIVNAKSPNDYNISVIWNIPQCPGDYSFSITPATYRYSTGSSGSGISCNLNTGMIYSGEHHIHIEICKCR